MQGVAVREYNFFPDISEVTITEIHALSDSTESNNAEEELPKY